MSTVLEKDSEIHFPEFVVLKASAGSGKTHTLTERFVQLLLSPKIPGNNLRNILAITFSNNAAKEMKERTLSWLKSICFEDAGKVAELSRIVSLEEKKMIEESGRLIDEILQNYSDFQIRTIDSFMTTVFKASAIDFGYNSEFDILMNNDAVMKYSFDLFLRNVREGAREAFLLEEIVSTILSNKKKDASYLWDPSTALLDEIKKIYRTLAATGRRPIIEDHDKEMAIMKNMMRETVERIESLIEKSGLPRNNGSAYKSVLPLVREGRFANLMGKGMKIAPVKKADGETHDRILALWEKLGKTVRQYTSFYVLSCYAPYLRVYEEFSETVERVKKNQGKVFIEDINRNLSEYLDSEIVPDVYFRIGETVLHFLIDEFQDTSPIQWRNLFPLIENSLSQRGSAFIVGDTKQAIYGFRNADYTIMKDSERENPFPSARHSVRELDTNFRSLAGILEFNERVFRDIVARSADYREAGKRSGLIDYVQRPREDAKRKGHAEVMIVEKNDDDPPERLKVQQLISELRKRGYRLGDMAILTQKNEDAVRATVWLNEKDVPFISFSSLDIRRRKITGEIVALLNFLDSPTDSLSFATFVLGDIFSRTLEKEASEIRPEDLRDFVFVHRDDSPLYKSFREVFGSLWERYFSDLFRSSGYFPLYDLVSMIFSTFRVFEIAGDEEAALVKILEVVKDFEGEGYNSLGDFLDFAGNGEDPIWDMDVPKGIDAVKVMTIHKAKGLGFPVVIVLLYEDRNRGFDYIAKEEGDGVRLLRITKETLTGDPVFEALYHEESVRDLVNKLNSLYVGFTRPQEELYVIGIKGKSRGYPFDLLPTGSESASGEPEMIVSATAEVEEFRISHHHGPIEFSVGPEEMISTAERRRGDFIHRVLSFVRYREGAEEELSAIIGRVRTETGAEYSDEEIREVVMNVISRPETAEYFTERPGREIWTEKEYSDRNGNLFRMDRVVIDSDRLTVIDYKTGADKGTEEKYSAQMKSYMKILCGIYNDMPVEGLLVYVDLGKDVRIL